VVTIILRKLALQLNVLDCLWEGKKRWAFRMDDIVPEEKKMMSKEQWEEAIQYLRAYNILLRDEINGEPVFKLNATFVKTILRWYDECILMFRPKSLLDGALVAAVIDFTRERLPSKQMAMVCTVLKPFAEELIKRTTTQ
jgi:hypothetical protein